MTAPEPSGVTPQPLANWDNEGGALDPAGPFAKALPEGISTRMVREYIVGTYRYTDLALAVAERDRQRAGNGD